MLSHVRIVLVNTSHPGNIGSTARAMKTMGLEQLYLVEPKEFPHPKAYEMASGACDVLDKTKVVGDLSEAISDCHLIVGTSARDRSIPWPKMSPRQFAACARSEASHSHIAVVFGREQSGLTNEELQRCHFHIQIPSHSEYSSLNLAAAVQVIAYELYIAFIEKEETDMVWDYPYAQDKELQGFYNHLEQVLIQLAFLNPKAPRQLMARLQRLFQRARLDVMEVNILRGILKEIEMKCKIG